MRPSLVSAAIFSLAMSVSAGVHAVSVGEIDTFSADIEGWFAGGGPFGQEPPVPPMVVADGGPAGAGDSFLQLTSNGSGGPGGRLVGMNASQWAGNYSAAGITSIAMDLRNLGSVDLTIRLYFEDPIPGPPLNEAVTSFGMFLPAGSDWMHAVFPIWPGALTVLQGDATTLLSNTTVLRIFHDVDPVFPPARIAGVLGIDNIQAIPEPDTVALLALGVGVVSVWTRRRRKVE
jgi:hypothetical protein